MTAKKTKPMNQRLAELTEAIYYKYPRLNSKAQLRDICDLASGGELDCTQLDILHDMVIQRINNPRVGEVLNIDCQRKGKFTIRLTSIDKEWLTGKIIQGEAKAMLSFNVKEEGEEVTLRRSLCYFYPVKVS